jgi:uncharacterized membrane protein
MKFLFILPLLFLFFSLSFLSAHASAAFVSTNYSILLVDNIFEETISITINTSEPISRIIHPLGEGFSLVEHSNNCRCSITSDDLICDLKEPLGDKPQTISAKIRLNKAKERGYILETESGKIFRFKISPEIDNSIAINLKLPPRAILAKWSDDGSESIVYPRANLTTDGESIILNWKRELRAGEPFEVMVGYSMPTQQENYFILTLLCILCVVSGFSLGIKYKRHKKRETIIKLLREDEQKIVDILREAGGELKQKDIEEKIGFSGPKVSKLLRRLEEDGIIKKTPKGRENIIKLRI